MSTLTDEERTHIEEQITIIAGELWYALHSAELDWVDGIHSLVNPGPTGDALCAICRALDISIAVPHNGLGTRDSEFSDEEHHKILHAIGARCRSLKDLSDEEMDEKYYKRNRRPENGRDKV